MKVNESINNIARMFAVFSITVIASTISLAKSWNEISPLKTTRSEVIELLGSPKSMDKEGRAVFETPNEIVHISWVRPNCYRENETIPDNDVKGTFLVYQITLDPKARKVSDEFPDIKEQNRPADAEREDSKATYKRWLSQDVDCLGVGDSMSCSIINPEKGFGYSESKERGVFGIYYFPTNNEIKAFTGDHALCAEHA